MTGKLEEYLREGDLRRTCREAVSTIELQYSPVTGHWSAAHGGPLAEEVRDLFGADVLPIPYIGTVWANDPMAKRAMIRDIEDRNPGVTVTVAS